MVAWTLGGALTLTAEDLAVGQSGSSRCLTPAGPFRLTSRTTELPSRGGITHGLNEILH